ncbi:TetR/AcrR family transcriptional regulator [Rhizobium ruizarguesonis]|uniref:TetR/AcrR family transcriptional regulator n=1 Tax=Rhizobium ruizarguesonis TaxID=2081791 RepID=A0ACD5ENN0_9HYPH
MRADAEKNRSQILTVARDVVTEHGTDASMRDIARRAGVGLATLLRHFPTREALFEALLCTNLDALTQKKADELEASTSADEALLSWFRELVAFTQSYRGVVAMMAAARTNLTPLFMHRAQRCTQQARDYCSMLRARERRAPI